MKYISKRKDFLDAVSKLENTEVLYDKDGIVIVRIKSWHDCNVLFDRDSIHWCIARNESHWIDYVAKPFTKQYFIVDFNKINNENNFEEFDKALIGITVSAGEITFAHSRSDYDLISRFNKKAREWGKMIHLLEHILEEKGIYDFVIKDKFKTKKIKASNNGNEPSLFGVWFVILVIMFFMTLAALTFSSN